MVSIRYNKTLWIALFLSLFFSFSFIFSDVLFERNDLGYKALSILNQFFVTIFMSLVIYWIVVRTRDTDNQVVQLRGILNFISIVIKSFDTEGKNEKLIKLEELETNLELGRKRIKRFSILGIALISLLLVNGLLNCFIDYFTSQNALISPLINDETDIARLTAIKRWIPFVLLLLAFMLVPSFMRTNPYEEK
jgi:hypothetical protein